MHFPSLLYVLLSCPFYLHWFDHLNNMLLDEGYESVAASVRFLGLMLLAVPINVVLLCLV